MLFIGGSDAGIGDHAGYVAGRYRDGALSDLWTDVARCAPATFTAFLPACGCGWRGGAQAPDEAGARRCRREWTREHLRHVVPTRHASSRSR
jgi:hypothetical protein